MDIFLAPYGDPFGSFGPPIITDYVQLLLGRGDGTFTPPSNFDLAGGQSPVGMARDDFDNDGHEDIAVANTTSDGITILINNMFP